MPVRTDEGVVFQFPGDKVPDLLSREEEVALAKIIEQEREKAKNAKVKKAKAEARVKKAKGKTAKARARVEARKAETEIKAAEAKAKKAKDRFVETNLRLVIKMAGRYRGRGVPMADLIQEGNIGLLTAVEKFDWRRGYHFCTCASPWIRQALGRTVDDQGPIVRVPTNTVNVNRQLQRTRVSFAQTHGREQTDEETAEIFGWPLEKVQRVALRLERTPRYREQILTGARDQEVAGVFEENLPDEREYFPEDEIGLAELRQCLDELLPTLKPIERDVYRLRLRHEERLVAVGRRYNLTRERIRQIQLKVEEKIRRYLQRRLRIVRPSLAG